MYSRTARILAMLAIALCTSITGAGCDSSTAPASPTSAASRPEATAPAPATAIKAQGTSAPTATTASAIPTATVAAPTAAAAPTTVAEATATAAPPKDASSQAKDYEVCSLLTEADIEPVIGKLAREPETRDQPMGRVVMMHQCQYFGSSSPQDYVTLQLTQRHPENKQEKFDFVTWWQSQREGYEAVDTKTQNVAGLGDEAYWVDGKDLGEDVEFYLCPVCGHIEMGKPEGRCKVCGADAAKFSQL